MPLASNDDWLSYLQNASHWQWPLVLLVGVYQKPLINIEAAVGDKDVDEEVEEPNIEAGGTAAPQYVADEGENIPRIVEQLRDEDRELDEAMNADSSDDDEDVPEEWVSSDFSYLVIDEGPNVPWDCRENEVVQGARYQSIDEVKEAVKC
ncbi:hypothetical protein GQ55_2G108300 [Panicum hallii var. hallii]|uniref:Uncharacterized protein n=1 Tax=Panicum hallii var. hallii TaxID=1504633 RepID=A0A2T7ENN3_9POAL|nr:hypothetical protein GQ55_2G108300 [Panicum hallii var. hallii]